MENLVNSQDENIGIIENILLAFRATETHIKGLSNDITDMMEYKMFVLCLDNAVELLFKFMISRREEILLYADEKPENVLKKYKKAREKDCVRLETFFYKYPMENDLHTISFSRACDYLTYYYQVINQSFASKCMKLAQIRNGFIHYSATIRYIDVVTFLHIYKHCVKLFNKEIADKSSINLELLCMNKNMLDAYSLYHMDMDAYSGALKICQDTIKRETFDNTMFLHIVGFVMDEYQRSLIEVCPENYSEIETKFFDEKSKLYGNNVKKKREEFREVYKIMVDAEIVYQDDSIYEEMSTIMIAEWVLDELEKRWDDDEQKKQLQCKKSASQVLELLRNESEEFWY